MPLFQSGNFPVVSAGSGEAGGRWALWRLDEPEEHLLQLLNHALFPVAELQQIRVTQRRQEWLGCRLALQALLAEAPQPELEASICLHKNEQGRPFLNGCGLEISLSHAYPFAGAALHPQRPVGLDVEQPRQQLLRIKHKFLSEQEQEQVGDDLQQLCLWWAAKEALYKMWGQPGLIFARDMQLASAPKANTLLGWLMGHPYELHYQWHGNLLLCVVA